MPFLFQSRSLYDNRNQKLKSLFSYFRKNWCLASFKTIFFFTWNDFHFFFLVFVSTINQTENSLLCGYDCFCVYVSLIFIFHFPFLTPQFYMFIFMKKKNYELYLLACISQNETLFLFCFVPFTYGDFSKCDIQYFLPLNTNVFIQPC